MSIKYYIAAISSFLLSLFSLVILYTLYTIFIDLPDTLENAVGYELGPITLFSLVLIFTAFLIFTISAISLTYFCLKRNNVKIKVSLLIGLISLLLFAVLTFGFKQTTNQMLVKANLELDQEMQNLMDSSN